MCCALQGSHLSSCSADSPPAAAPTLSPRSPGGGSSDSTLGELPATPPAARRGLASTVQQLHPWAGQLDVDALEGSPYSAPSIGAAATPPPAGGLGDHLSDATPSSAGASSLSFKVPAAAEVVALGHRATFEGGDRERAAGSEAAAAAGAAGAGADGQGGWAGLGALRALKSRLAFSRRAAA